MNDNPSEIVAETNIPYEKGYFYFFKIDDKGNIKILRKKVRDLVSDEQKRINKKAYYQKHKEYVRARQKKWYWEHREEQLKRIKKFHSENKEILRKRSKERYRRKKEQTRRKIMRKNILNKLNKLKKKNAETK